MAKQKSSLASFGLLSMAATVIGFVVALLVSIFVLQSMVNAGHRQQVGELIAAELAQQINIKESEIQALLTQLAATDLAREGINGSTSDLLQAEGRLVAMIPGAARVKLIKLGEARPDQGFPPLNYTAVDLIRNAEEGRNPPAEAISSQPQLEGQKWLVFAVPIKTSTGDLRGTLFCHINAESMIMDVAGTGSGEVRVTQNVGTTAKTIASAGTGAGGSALTAKLANPNWTMHYVPAAAISDGAPAPTILYLAPALVMLVFALVGIFVSSHRSGSLLAGDLETLGRQIGRVRNGNFDGDAAYQLPGFREQNLALQDLAKAPPKAAAQPKLSKKAETRAEATKDMVEIEMVDSGRGDTEIDEFSDDDFESVGENASAGEPKVAINPEIFRAYDIRGVVGENLSEDIARQIGLAIGSEAAAQGQQSLLVGFDGRDYSPALAEALMDGLTASGRDVINIGSVPTPVLYYATQNSSSQSGVMVTGSHNAPDYNGFKVVLAGKTLSGGSITALYDRISNSNFSSGEGTMNVSDFTQEYMDAIADDVVVAQPLKVVVDCANGIAGAFAPELLDNLGCEAVPLYCEVDGSFPNHHPDPTRPENLEDLALTVQSQGADLGLAIDGDGDRLVAVTAEGDIVWPDKLLMLFAKDIVSRNPGSDVIYDVKCTRHLNSVISGFGGRPIISRSGHAFIKEKLAETGALLGGELSGHICFSERWFGFDDALYSAARLLEIVGSQEEGLTELLQEFPVSISTPEIHVEVSDEEKFDLVNALVAAADFEDATMTTVDGLRVDFSDGWGLVRASNTEPAITLRFEADNEEILEDIKAAFRELLQENRSDLDFK